MNYDVLNNVTNTMDGKSSKGDTVVMVTKPVEYAARNHAAMGHSNSPWGIATVICTHFLANR